MKKYFVWTRDIERVIHETLSGKRKRRASNGDAIVKVLSRAAEASEHYYSLRTTMYEFSRTWKCINRSSTYRMFGRK